MKAVILSDGLDGHFNQSIGVAEMLKGTILTSYKIIDVKLKHTFFRGLVHSYIKILSKKLNKQKYKYNFKFF